MGNFSRKCDGKKVECGQFFPLFVTENMCKEGNFAHYL